MVLKRALPFTSRVADGFVVPMPTEPIPVTTKGLASGVVSSSTTRALPEPNWVILNASEELFTDIVVTPETPTFPMFVRFLLSSITVVFEILIAIFVYTRLLLIYDANTL